MLDIVSHIIYISIPIVSHKEVAEVSTIGNFVVMHGWHREKGGLGSESLSLSLSLSLSISLSL